MIDHYFRYLQDLITKTFFISTVNLQMERRSVTVGFVRGDLTFEDGSKLHYPKLENAPHHKHIGEKDVISSQAPDLESILKEIGYIFMP